MNIYEIRRANLERLTAEKGAKTHLAMRLGCTQAFISQLLRDPAQRNSRIIHEHTARAIEQALLLQPLELDKPYTGAANPVLQPTLRPAMHPTAAPQPVVHIGLPMTPAAPSKANDKALSAMGLEFLELAANAGTLDEAKRFADAAKRLLQLGH